MGPERWFREMAHFRRTVETSVQVYAAIVVIDLCCIVVIAVGMESLLLVH